MCVCVCVRMGCVMLRQGSVQACALNITQCFFSEKCFPYFIQTERISQVKVNKVCAHAFICNIKISPKQL